MSTSMRFSEKLERITQKNNSLVCIGLDIDKDLMPSFLFEKKSDPYVIFAQEIINATKDIVCAYKINLAFYEALGLQGYSVLQQTIDAIPKNIPVILDGKRNDVGNTAKKYAHALFNELKADAITITPYLGFDGIQPFIEYKDKGVFILCRTSNPSAPDLQNYEQRGKPLYEHVAEHIKTWNTNKNCGAVVGATYPKELQKIRQILGEDIPLLIPGIGKQGGDLKQAVQHGTNGQGKLALMTSSRAIIYAGKTRSFSEDARQAATSLRDAINDVRM